MGTADVSIATEHLVQELLERVKRLEAEVAALKAKSAEKSDGRKK
jgi:uncharacterized small protein (DUF1192 family)